MIPMFPGFYYNCDATPHTFGFPPGATRLALSNPAGGNPVAFRFDPAPGTALGLTVAFPGPSGPPLPDHGSVILPGERIEFDLSPDWQSIVVITQPMGSSTLYATFGTAPACGTASVVINNA